MAREAFTPTLILQTKAGERVAYRCETAFISQLDLRLGPAFAVDIKIIFTERMLRMPEPGNPKPGNVFITK